MQQVILGLLILHGPLSLYAVQRHFQQGVSLFYSASFGSIQRALRQLADAGLATVSVAPGDARGSKPYTITDAGRTAWQEWMAAPIAGADIETIALAKTFFLGLVDDPSARAAAIDTILARVGTDLATLEEVERQLDAAEVPAELAEIARYQRATLEYGVRSHRLALEWAEGLR